MCLRRSCLLVYGGRLISPPTSTSRRHKLPGEKFLADGILPTTNEISILKYLEPGEGGGAAQGELVQERDGLFVRRLPADLLIKMNIVDTPGGCLRWLEAIDIWSQRRLLLIGPSQNQT